MDPVQLVRLLERDADARAIGSDHVAHEVERARGFEDRIADGDRPGGPLGRNARQMRTIEPHADHVRVGRVEKVSAANGAARFTLERGEVDRDGGIEHDPKRVGAMEDGHGRRRPERKRHFQAGTLPRKLDRNLIRGLLIAQGT